MYRWRGQRGYKGKVICSSLLFSSTPSFRFIVSALLYGLCFDFLFVTAPSSMRSLKISFFIWQDVPDYCVVAGNPARIIRHLTESEMTEPHGTIPKKTKEEIVHNDEAPRPKK